MDAVSRSCDCTAGRSSMTKVFRMHVLGAEYGDCLWVDYGEAIAPYRILVDAGTPATFKRLKVALERVRGDKPSHQLFIVTHVDSDHIGGALPVLEDPDLASQFADVWFNGRHHLLQATDEEAFGAVQGERLTAAILARRLPWNSHFGGRAVVRDLNECPVTFDLEGGARISVLTPGIKQLQKLLPKWDKEVRKAGLDPLGLVPQTEATEGEEVFGGVNVDALAQEKTREDLAEANGSSISTLIEFGDKRLLLCADSHPSVLVEGIRKLTGGKPLAVDVFKLPHHGSKANVTKELLDMVDAKVVVFSTNGERFQHPDREAVARVIRRYGKSAKLVFNYRSKYTSIWEEPNIRDEWGYSIEYGNDDGGVSIMVHES